MLAMPVPAPETAIVHLKPRYLHPLLIHTKKPARGGLVVGLGFSNPRLSGVARFSGATARFLPRCTQSHYLPCKTLLAGRFGRSGGVLRRGWSGFFNPCHRAAGCPGVGSFVCLPEERLLDVFESTLVFDSYAQQVLRFRVLGH